jgi:hypothetical protein
VKSKYSRRDTAGRFLAGVALTLSLAGMSGCITAIGGTRDVRIGGVDLQGFCDDRSFEIYDEAGASVTCHENIDLLAACKREYNDAVLFKLKDPNNPKTGLCYKRMDASGDASLGGIKDMTGYCGKVYPGPGVAVDSRVRAELVGKTWQCRMPVDVSAVCVGQHNDLAVRANRVGNDWNCYRKE